MTEDKYDLLVAGCGPAGFAAMIYGGRAGLSVLAVDSGAAGGQMGVSPMVENYPGYEGILGMELAEKMRAHALQYGKLVEGYQIDKVTRTPEGFLAEGGGKSWLGRSLLLSTGASHRELGVPGEKEYYGKGVSYCATCDAFFYKGRRVVVVGGGDSALSEATYLLSNGSDVTVIHRRGELRAEKSNQDAFLSRGGKLMLDSVVERFTGDSTLKSATIKNLKTGETQEFAADGAFIAIGYDPRNDLARTLGAELDADGYVKVDAMMRTSVPGVMAAGDVTGGLKQIVYAVYSGARAAMTSFEELRSPYWLGK